MHCFKYFPFHQLYIIIKIYLIKCLISQILQLCDFRLRFQLCKLSPIAPDGGRGKVQPLQVSFQNLALIC